MRRGRLGDSTGVWEIAGAAVVLRAGVRGCGCFCAAIGSGWAVRGDAGNCGYGCRSVCGWAWSLLLLLSCVAFWGGQCVFSGKIARKSRKFQQKPEFSAGIGREWGGIAPWWASSGAGRWKIMDAIVVLRAGAHGRSHYYNVSPICVTLHSDEGGARFFWRESGKIRNNCAVGGEGLAEQGERKGARAAAILRASERGSSAARLPHCHAGGFDANGRIC